MLMSTLLLSSFCPATAYAAAKNHLCMPSAPRVETLPEQRLRNPHGWLALVVGLLLGAGVAPSAYAHVTLTPSFTEVGVSTRVVFEAPNEREGRVTTSLRLEAPVGIELEPAPAPAGWRLALAGRVATWTGGRLERTDVVGFPLVVTARTDAGVEAFEAVQGYDDGESVRWEAALTVLPAPAGTAPSQRLGRALVAGAVGLGVLGLSMLVLWRARRP